MLRYTVCVLIMPDLKLKIFHQTYIVGYEVYVIHCFV